jgi:hypothetical protein
MIRGKIKNKTNLKKHQIWKKKSKEWGLNPKQIQTGEHN